jgi:hypothetical protein
LTKNAHHLRKEEGRHDKRHGPNSEEDQDSDEKTDTLLAALEHNVDHSTSEADWVDINISTTLSRELSLYLLKEKIIR